MTMYVIRSGRVPAEILCNGALVTNYGPSTVYYSDSQDVTNAFFEGSLASGTSASLEGSQFFTTTGARASLNVGTPPATLADGVSDVVQSFSVPGEVPAATGSAKFRLPFNMSLVNIAATVGTPPTGVALIVDINRNGSSVFTSSAHRPSIAPGGTTSTVPMPDLPGLSEGDLITVDVDQVGSGTAGSDLTVTLYMQRSTVAGVAPPPPPDSPTPPTPIVSPFVYDTFTGANNTLLPDHTGEIGGSWTAITNFGDALTIGQNAVYGTGASNFAACMASGAPPGSHNYSVRGLIIVRSVLSGSYAQVLGRQHISADTAYQLTLTAANQLILQSKVTAVTTQIGVYDLALDELLIEGQERTIDLVLTGSTISANLDGEEKISVSNSAITGVASDHVGLRLRNSTSSTGLVMGTFSAGPS